MWMQNEKIGTMLHYNTEKEQVNILLKVDQSQEDGLGSRKDIVYFGRICPDKIVLNKENTKKIVGNIRATDFFMKRIIDQANQLTNYQAKTDENEVATYINLQNGKDIAGVNKILQTIDSILKTDYASLYQKAKQEAKMHKKENKGFEPGEY